MGAREEAREIQRLKRNLDGAPIRTQAATREYREGWERVFVKESCSICGGEIGPDITGRPCCYDCCSRSRALRALVPGNKRKSKGGNQ